jgi:hypothetical protein
VERADLPPVTSDSLNMAVAQDAEPVDLAPLARLLLSLARQRLEQGEQARPQRAERVVESCRPRGHAKACGGELSATRPCQGQ